jgi:hypothetical protein
MLSKLVIQAVWVRKSDGTPEHKWLEIHEQTHKRAKERGDKESPKGCIRLKSCEPLYTCTRPLFYRETKGLLHSEITLRSKEYSKQEHAHECLLHLVTCGANFRYLQVCHPFTP